MLDWFTYWNKNEDADIQEILESMNTEIAFNSYYKNSLLYIMASKQRFAIWNEYMICQDIQKLKNLCELGENINDKQKRLRCQGIRLLSSEKIMKAIEYIVNREKAIWFNEKNKDTLLMFNNKFIEINGRKMSIDHLKSLYG